MLIHMTLLLISGVLSAVICFRWARRLLSIVLFVAAVDLYLIVRGWR